MPVAIKGTGGGSVTLDAGSAAADSTLTLPNTSGTLLTTGTVVTAAQGGTGLTSPGTNGNVLTSNGSAWTSSAAPAPADGSITPAKLSTGGPSWTSGGVLSFNSGYGSTAVAYGCRAWVNYNSNAQTIRASANVSSVTYNSTGYYTVNFINSMPDANYSVVAMGEWTSGVTSQTLPSVRASTPPATANCPLVNQGSGFRNSDYFLVAFFR